VPPGGLHMKHRYDLFEKYPDGSSLWRDSVSGFKLTRLRLQELSQKSENQYYALDLTTGDVLAFISQRAMLMDPAHFQKLKDEARASSSGTVGMAGASWMKTSASLALPNG
jgi:hypothetical protein